MNRTTLSAWAAACAIAASSCANSPQSPVSPSATGDISAFANADGSLIKATAPAGLSPNGGTIGTRRPTLSFTNPSASFTSIGFAYEIEVQDAAGAVLYSRVIGETPVSSNHQVDIEFAYATTLWWRARSRLGDQAGPWSEFAQFRTPDPPPPPPTPTPTTPTAGGLPFPPPAECGNFGTGNRFACVAAVARVSAEWAGCTGGSGAACFRFTRHVVMSLAASDPNWGLITKNPGEQQCTIFACGPSVVGGFGEDIAAYRDGPTDFDWRGWDLVVSAGAPGAGLNWSQVSGRRPGNNWTPVR